MKRTFDLDIERGRVPEEFDHILEAALRARLPEGGDHGEMGHGWRDGGSWVGAGRMNTERKRNGRRQSRKCGQRARAKNFADEAGDGLQPQLPSSIPKNWIR